MEPRVAASVVWLRPWSPPGPVAHAIHMLAEFLTLFSCQYRADIGPHLAMQQRHFRRELAAFG